MFYLWLYAIRTNVIHPMLHNDSFKNLFSCLKYYLKERKEKGNYITFSTIYIIVTKHYSVKDERQ